MERISVEGVWTEALGGYLGKAYERGRAREAKLKYDT